MASDKFFAASESSLCPSSIYLRTGNKRMQGVGTVIDEEININRMLRYMLSIGSFKTSLPTITQNNVMA